MKSDCPSLQRCVAGHYACFCREMERRANEIARLKGGLRHWRDKYIEATVTSAIEARSEARAGDELRGFITRKTGWYPSAAELEHILALAAATGTAKTPKAVECEASQSGPKGNAHEQY